MNDIVTHDLCKSVLRNIKKCLPSNISKYSVHEPNLSAKVKKELNNKTLNIFEFFKPEYLKVSIC